LFEEMQKLKEILEGVMGTMKDEKKLRGLRFQYVAAIIPPTAIGHHVQSEPMSWQEVRQN
jgi:hypothetical protein